MRRHHDMGGLDAGPVEQSEHDHSPSEKKVDAIMRLLADDRRRVITVDEAALAGLVTRDGMIGVVSPDPVGGEG